MRIALVVHAFPPEQHTGVELHCARLARALVRAEHAVEVFAAGRAAGRPHLSLRRSVTDGHGLSLLALNEAPRSERERREARGAAEVFGAFLDREQPDVVHFQHLVKLGPALIAEARRRGVPTVYTAHDPYPVCADYQLLRPDLEQLAWRDPTALALAELARRRLEGAHPEGHGGCVLPALLEPGLRAELAELLAGDPARAGYSQEEVAHARERVEAETTERLDAFRGLDLLLAPTEWLGHLLATGGLDGAELEPCGLELPEEPPAADAPTEPLRCGFFGGLRPHKGAHLLLDACEGLAGATLALHGDGDPLYVEHVVARAREVGAEVAGGYGPGELHARLAATDVVVVPSIWPENAPFVIREAFAAGKPVVAYDVGALAESVRDGVDGLLVPARDVAALRDALASLAGDRGLLERLRAGIQPVLSIEAEAERLVARYRGLLATAASVRDAGRAELPAHLSPFAGRLRALERIPTRDLVTRCLNGLSQLEDLLRPTAVPAEATGAFLAAGEALREQLADARRRAAWLAEVSAGERGEVRELQARLAWREEVLAERDGRLAWLAEQLEDKRALARALEAERDLAREAGRNHEREARWLGEDLEAVRGERDWLAEQRGELGQRSQWLEEQAAGLGAERDWLARRVEESGRELAWRSELLADVQARLAEAEQARGDAGEAACALEEERDWLSERVRAAKEERDWLGERARAAEAGFAAAQTDLGALRKHQAWLEAEARRLQGALGEVERQLAWHAEELRAARSEARQTLLRLLNPSLYRRVQGWTDPQGAAGEEDAS